MVYNTEDLIGKELAAKWDTLLSDGTIGPIFQDMENLPVSLEYAKTFLRMQLFDKAIMHEQVLQEFEALQDIENLSPEMVLDIARMLAKAGGKPKAEALLHEISKRLVSIELLELLLQTAAFANEDLQSQIAQQLQNRSPGSRVLKEYLLLEYLSADDYRSAAEICAGNPARLAQEQVYTLMAKALSNQRALNYDKIIQSAQEIDATLSLDVKITCANHALKRGLVNKALDLIISGDHEPMDDRKLSVLARSLEQMLLDRYVDGGLEEDFGRAQSLLVVIVSYLAEHPKDTSLRSRLNYLLSASVSGRIGRALLSFFALMLFKRPIITIKRKPISPVSSEELGSKESSFEAIFEWLEGQMPCILGRVRLPDQLIVEPRDQMAATMLEYLEGPGLVIDADSNASSIEIPLLVGTMMAAHSAEPNCDLEMIRVVAAKYALARQVQRTRDLAENALFLSEGSLSRIRKAWRSVADVYQRVGNNTESLLAISCAFSIQCEIDEDESSFEAFVLIRALRDLGMFELAREAHSILRERRGNERSTRNRLRVEFWALQLDAMEQYAGDDYSGLSSLLKRFTEHAQAALDENDDGNLLPFTVIFGQLLSLAQSTGIETPTGSKEAFDALLERIPEKQSSLVHLFTAYNPSPEQLTSLVKGLEKARYAEDVAHDVRHIVLAAERLLASEEALQKPEIAAFAIELLADRAIADYFSDTMTRPIMGLREIDEAAEIASRVSSEGICVLMGASDTKSNLITVSAVKGELHPTQKESTDVFSMDDFRVWAKEFPYRYGKDTETANLFHTTTNRLGISALPGSRTLLVFDSHLQQIPPNLLRIKDEFAGSLCAMASAPSLSWLATVRHRDRKSSGKLAAWIPLTDDKFATLNVLATRLGETLEANCIELFTSFDVPDSFASSDLAVVAAHGGVAQYGQYFQSISDDSGIVIPPSWLATKLREVSIVVLFVCSSGRVDKHPTGASTVGLVKQLLERSCSAVIAPPWPLAAKVPTKWLPEFIKNLRDGAPVIDANFSANNAIAIAYSNEPRHSLAMNVYGDPSTRLCT